jgi:ADP-ribosylglycohydrolase
MLQGKYDTAKKDELKQLIEESTQCGLKHIILKEQEKEMRNHIKVKNLKDLKLDDSKAIGYTFKALGCGFYGLRKGTDFRQTIIELIMEGGDADSNGAVCGAMLGCKVGYSGLPQDLLQFVHRQWLDNKVDKFLEAIGLKI